MGDPSYGTWGPMYRYSDLFDRPMRSQLRSGKTLQRTKKQYTILGFILEQNSPVNIQPHISSYSAFSPSQQMSFVPFYSGIGKGR